MKYDECLQVLSPARLNKYAQASGNENMGHRTKRILRIERKEYQTY